MAVTKPRVRDEITICPIEGEAVLYDPSGSHLHYLNHSAALVLDLCDGSVTMKEMAEEIADVYEMRIDEVEKQVRTTVRELRARKLLVPTTRREADEAARAAESARTAIDEREEIRIHVTRSS